MNKNRFIERKLNSDRIKSGNLIQVDFFYPREHAILGKYFNLQKKLPKCAREINPNEMISEEDYDESESGIICQPSYGDHECNSLANAVARIALAPKRMSLPTWGGYENGKIFHSRQKENDSLLPCRGFHSEPLHVLSINWADSGPGFSWPVKYYISWIPYYERYVVTVSYDCPLLEGYLDLAIGYLSLGAEIETDLKGLILDDWNHKAEFLEAWADCINQGIVKDPWAWRSEVDWKRNK